MRMNRIACLAMTSIALATVPAAARDPHGAQRPAAHPAQPGAPDLTSQGRFVYGPAFGHTPLLGGLVDRAPARRQRFHAAPFIVPGAVAVPGFYPTPPYALAPDATSRQPEESPPPGRPAPAYPPLIAYVPLPYPVMQPPPAREPAPPTPIYFCVESNAYTNDVESLDCPAGWKRMTR